MKKVLRITLFAFLGLIILAAFLNPNTESFKSFAKDVGDSPGIIYKRKANYLIFSVYIKQIQHEEYYAGTLAHGTEYPAFLETKEYYGFAGNFFEIDNQKEARITAPAKIEQPVNLTPVILGPNAHIWMDQVGKYLSKRPQASDSELFKRFPQLMNDRRVLDVACSYFYAKSGGMSDEEGKKLYPEAYK